MTYRFGSPSKLSIGLTFALSAGACAPDGLDVDAAASPEAQQATSEGAQAAFAAAAPEQAGPYVTATQRDVGPEGAFTLVAPRDLASSPRKHPVITWGNGTGTSPSVYGALLNRLASHGFVIIASNSPNTGSANEMLQGVDWVLAENARADSPMYQKLDPTNIGATGHSQGGFGTCAATRDPRIKTIAPIMGYRAPASAFRGAVIAIAGGEDTVVTPGGIRSGVGRITRGPAMYAELKTVGHADWISSRGDGAELNALVVAWMRVHLMADAALRDRFYGQDCGYCTDADWTIQQIAMQ